VTASNQVVLGTASESVIIPNRITYGDGTNQSSKYSEDILNDVNAHSFVAGRTILQSTFNLANSTNASLVAVGSGFHFFVAIQLIKGQTYTGAGFYSGTAGNWGVALYGSGFQATRYALSTTTASSALSWNYIAFINPYIATTTEIGFIGLRTTSALQTALYLPANTYLNFGYDGMTNGTFNKRSQYYANAADFPASIASGAVQINQTQLAYMVLY
jgi:hypothetical protein